METTMNVYKCINAVAAEISQEGISKDRRNQQQGYNFRGIDDVYNALAPVIAKHGLVILPRCISRELTERNSAKGGVLFTVVVEAEFDFVSSHDGSKHTVKTYGEAMDSADKATNKAMSAAYKYAAFQTFCIPTEGDNDADATTHHVSQIKREEAKPAAKPVAQQAPQPASQPKAAPAPAKIEGRAGEWQLKVEVTPAEGNFNAWAEIIMDATKLALEQAQSEADVMAVFRANANIYNRMKEEPASSAYSVLLEEFKAAKAKFTNKEAA